MMKSNKTFWWTSTALAATVLALTACGGGGNDDVVATPVVNTTTGTVPDSVGATSASFLAFIRSLAVGDETSEPLVFGSSFASPAEDGAEPEPLA